MKKGKLYISETGTVVVFTGRILGNAFSGVVVICGEQNGLLEDIWEIGDYSQDWSVEKFQEFDGEIILNND